MKFLRSKTNRSAKSKLTGEKYVFGKIFFRLVTRTRAAAQTERETESVTKIGMAEGALFRSRKIVDKGEGQTYARWISFVYRSRRFFDATSLFCAFFAARRKNVSLYLDYEDRNAPRSLARYVKSFLFALLKNR